jgi:hypothetical protein
MGVVSLALSLSLWLGLAAAPAALADDVETVVDNAVACVDADPVCALGGASLDVDRPELAAALPTHWRLIVAPPSSLETDIRELSATDLARDVAEETGSAILVLVEKAPGSRSFGLAGGGLSAEQITECLTVLNRSSDAGGAAIIASAGELERIVGTASSSEATAEPTTGWDVARAIGDFFKKLLTVIGIVILLLVAGLVTAIVLILRHSSPKRRRTRAHSRVDKKLFDNSENADSVEKSLLKLRELADLYAAQPKKYTAGGAPIHGQINQVIVDVQELFRRLRANGTAQQARLAESKYADVLKKVVLTVDRDYYGDIVANPRLWSSPDERIKAIGQALRAVHEQVLENIKQVNASKDLEFMVVLDSLLESERAAKLSDVYGQTEPNHTPAHQPDQKGSEQI